MKEVIKRMKSGVDCTKQPCSFAVISEYSEKPLKQARQDFNQDPKGCQYITWLMISMYSSEYRNGACIKGESGDGQAEARGVGKGEVASFLSQGKKLKG